MIEIHEAKSSRGSLLARQDNLSPPGAALGLSGAANIEAGFVAFVALWLFIGLVSAYDGYLTVRYQNLLHSLEQNPVGRWIMDLDDGLVTDKDYGYVVDNRRLANFLGLKFAGTVLGLGLMLVVHRYKAALGLTITGIMAGLQGALAIYLSVA